MNRSRRHEVENIKMLLKSIQALAGLASQYDARVYPLESDRQKIGVPLGDLRKLRDALDEGQIQRALGLDGRL